MPDVIYSNAADLLTSDNTITSVDVGITAENALRTNRTSIWEYLLTIKNRLIKVADLPAGVYVATVKKKKKVRSKEVVIQK